VNLSIKVTPEAEKVFYEALNSGKKYVCWRKGRRVGATHNFAHLLIIHGLTTRSRILWGDVQHGNIIKYFDRYFRPVLNALPKEYWHWNETRKELRLINQFCKSAISTMATVIDFRSADANRATWEGFGYDMIVLNEAGIILRDPLLYKETILPMMLDNPKSILYAIGVPKGRTLQNGEEHPFYSIHKNSIDGKRGYVSYLNTSYDSPKATAEDIDNLIQELGGIESMVVRQEIFGEFVDAIQNVFLHSFNEEIHVKEVEYVNNEDIYLSWDFNVMSTCLVIQVIDGEIHVIDEYHLGPCGEKSGIEVIAEKVKRNYIWHKVIINGDASGQNNNAANRSFYQLVKSSIGWDVFGVPKANPFHKTSWLQCNFMFSKNKVIIHPRCKMLINDIKRVDIISTGGKIEINKADENLTHWLDCLRYHINAQHKKNIIIVED
jgi:hypothetical protein